MYPAGPARHPREPPLWGSARPLPSVGPVSQPFRFSGVYVATTTPFDEAGALDLDQFQAHCARLAADGVAGLVPVGSLGEYEALGEDERAAVVKAARDAVPGSRWSPACPASGGREARRWAEHAREADCPAVMYVPPTSHAPRPDEVVAHFGEVAQAGPPIIAYNNPYSTRVDLTPALLGRLSAEVEKVVAVKEFFQDVRRVAAIRQAAPRLEVICGCDDTLAEAVLMGATAWIAGFANAFPRQSVQLFDLCAAGNRTMPWTGIWRSSPSCAGTPIPAASRLSRWPKRKWAGAAAPFACLAWPLASRRQTRCEPQSASSWCSVS